MPVEDNPYRGAGPLASYAAFVLLGRMRMRDTYISVRQRYQPERTTLAIVAEFLLLLVATMMRRELPRSRCSPQ